jgi:hypothetical protein
VPGLSGRPIAFGVSARPLDTVPKIPALRSGVARHQGDTSSPSAFSASAKAVMQRLTREAKGEVDVRIVGRIDKRASARARRQPAATPWSSRGAAKHQTPVVRASVGRRCHGEDYCAFVKRGAPPSAVEHHVLIKEDQARTGDRILQRANHSGGSIRAGHACGSGSN